MKIDRKDYEKSITNDGGVKNENTKQKRNFPESTREWRRG